MPGDSHDVDNDDLLTNTHVEQMLDPDVVEWERLHTDFLASIYDRQATNKHNAAKRSNAFIGLRFKLYHVLAREYPPFLSTASLHKKAVWTSEIDALAAEFTCLFEE